MTVFSYSGRVNSLEWRWQPRRADLRHFESFRYGPIIINTRLPAGGTYYPICTFPASSECLRGTSDAFSAFCLRVSVVFHMCSLYPQQKRAHSALNPQAWTYTYVSMPEGSYRVQSPGFPKIFCYMSTSQLSHLRTTRMVVCSLKNNSNKTTTTTTKHNTFTSLSISSPRYNLHAWHAPHYPI